MGKGGVDGGVRGGGWGGGASGLKEWTIHYCQVIFIR